MMNDVKVRKFRPVPSVPKTLTTLTNDGATKPDSVRL